jgi:hypothetical protein
MCDTIVAPLQASGNESDIDCVILHMIQDMQFT